LLRQLNLTFIFIFFLNGKFYGFEAFFQHSQLKAENTLNYTILYIFETIIKTFSCLLNCSYNDLARNVFASAYNKKKSADTGSGLSLP